MKNTVCFGIIVGLGILLLTITAGTPRAQSDEKIAFKLDHFKVYKVKPMEMQQTVGLRGQFDKEVKKVFLHTLTLFANPVSKNGAKLIDRNAHLTWYALKQDNAEPKRRLVVRNQFGTQKLVIGRPLFLLVPAEKIEKGSVFPRHLDHYKCYEVLSGEPVQKGVALKDQFGGEKVKVMKPKLFAVPVEKHFRGRVEKIKNKRDHLVFYEISPKDYALRKQVRDQFGKRKLSVAASVMLGVPSLKKYEPQASKCIDFEDLPLGKKYIVGNTFTDSGTSITVRPFQWSNGNWTNNGYAKVGNGGKAGGSGKEMQVNNVNLRFNLGGSIRGLNLLFGEYGGNLNIRINGTFKNFGNFADINGANIGGVGISVVNGLGNDKGRLKLAGSISSFAVGGQELWIDHVCFVR